MTKTSGFKDVADLPTGKVKDKNGVEHVLEYAGHHIIPQTTYENSSFLQALGAAGLWKEYDFATNGVPLVAKIDGNTASHSEFRDLVGGSLHTGGHTSYRIALGEILANFDEAYKNQDWGSHGTKEAWLAAQAKKWHGVVAVLKLELASPHSGLVLDETDGRKPGVTAKAIWTQFSDELFDPATLEFNQAITSHPLYKQGSQFELGVHSGAATLDATPGKGSAIDIDVPFHDPKSVESLIDAHHGINQATPSIFHKAKLAEALEISKKSPSKIVAALAAAGLVTGILRHQDAMAKQLGRPVSFDEAGKDLGLEITEEGLRSMAGDAAFDLGVSAVLPAGWARQAWNLALAGEDVIGVIGLYQGLYPDNAALAKLNHVAKAVEASEFYSRVKQSRDDFKEALSSWLGSSAGQNAVSGRGGVPGASVLGTDLSWIPPGSEVVQQGGASVIDLPNLGGQLVIRDQAITFESSAPGVSVSIPLDKDRAAEYILDDKVLESDHLSGAVQDSMQEVVDKQITERSEDGVLRIIIHHSQSVDGVVDARDSAELTKLAGKRLEMAWTSDYWAEKILAKQITDAQRAGGSQLLAAYQNIAAFQRSWNDSASIISVSVLSFGSVPTSRPAAAAGIAMARVAALGTSSTAAASDVWVWLPNSAALTHAAFAIKGYAAMATGMVRAVGQASSSVRQNFAGDLATLQKWMTTQRAKAGNASALTEVTDRTLITLLPSSGPQQQVGSTVGRDMVSWIASSGQADLVLDAAVAAEDAAFSAMSTATTAAVAANLTGDENDRRNALSTARTAADLLGAAVVKFWAAYSISNSLAARLESARVELNKLIPLNMNRFGHLPGGASFYSAEDAYFASDTFLTFAKALQHGSDRRFLLDQLLAAFAQSAGYARVDLGQPGQTIALPNSFNLMVATPGDSRFTLSSNLDHLLLTSIAGTVTLNNFQSGSAGDQVQVAGLGDQVSLRRIAGGVELVTAVGGKQVVLNGANIDNFDLYANIAGVTVVSFANDTAAGVRNLRRPILFDGLVHVNELIASNYGDTLIGGDSNTVLRGGVGKDTLVVTGTGYYMDGGAGIDTVSYAESNYAIQASLSAGQDNLGGRLLNVENLQGSMWADRLEGNGRNNRLDGAGKDDLLIGAGGNDVYVFGIGYCADRIQNGVAVNAGASSVIEMRTGVAANQLWFERSGDDMVIRILGTDDTLTIEGWYVQAFRQVAVLALADGQKIDAAGMEQLASDLAAWRASNEESDPEFYVRLPLEINISDRYSTDFMPPTVGEAVDVDLETRQFYESGLTSQAVGRVVSVVNAATTISTGLASARSAAASQAGVSTPINMAGYRYLYRYRYRQPLASGEVVTGETLSFSMHDWSNPSNPLFGPPSNIDGSFTLVTSLDSGRFYYNHRINGASSGTGAPEEGSVGLISQMVQLGDQLSANTSNTASAFDKARVALLARQQALSAAVSANQTGLAADKSYAAMQAVNFETAFAASVRDYGALASYFSATQSALNAFQSLLDQAAPKATYTTYDARGVSSTHSFSFYSSTDEAKYQAFVAVRARANAAYVVANNQAQFVLNAFSGIGQLTNVQFASDGQSITAGSGGGLLIAGSGSGRQLVGGSGRDIYAFATSSGYAVDKALGFETGSLGDYLWIVPGYERRAYLMQSGGTLSISYSSSSSTTARVDLVGVDIKDFSLYDNLLGIQQADFSRMAGSVDISLASLTARDSDGFVHVTDLIGTSGNDRLVGDEQNNLIDGGAGNDTIYGGRGNNTLIGGAGIDTVAYQRAAAGVTVNLATNSAQNETGGTDTLSGFENVIGSIYADTLTGDAQNNQLDGGRGDDVLDGGAGNDILLGGTGNDVLLGGAGSDMLDGGAGDDRLDGGEGTDAATYERATAGVAVSLAVTTAQDTVGAGIDTLINIENLTGSLFNDTLTGNDLANVLNGKAGSDRMAGGKGNDVYYVDDVGDVVVEAAGEGTDAVYSYLGSYTLTDNVENLRMLRGGTVYATGNALNNVIYAGPSSNVINGGAGTDTLSYQFATSAVTVDLSLTTSQSVGAGRTDRISNIERLNGSDYNDTLKGTAANDYLNGGKGADTMIGGKGNDIYYVDNVGDIVIEAAGEGVDTVYLSASSYTLGANVEDLRFNTTAASNATGNALNNFFYAGAGNNVIDGREGSDTVSYVLATSAVNVSLATVAAQATGGSGTDTLINIENLTGSSYNDTLTGNAGNNVLDGGAGADRMVGGKGDDIYVVDNVGDVVVEAASEGIDQVNSMLAAYTLGANIERGRIMSSGAANMTGNSAANVIYAGAGNNVMDGGAGLDIVSYEHATAAVAVSLAVKTAQNTGGSGTDTLINIEHLVGSIYNDTLTGDATDNALNGNAGADRMVGGAGNDTYYVDNVGDVVVELAGGGTDTVNSYLATYSLSANLENLRIMSSGTAQGIGNAQDNILYAGDGDNVLDGGAGRDFISYLYATGAITASLATAASQTTGASGNDRYVSIEGLIGSQFGDTLSGSRGDDYLDGGAGSDTLSYAAADAGVRVSLGVTTAQDTGSQGRDTIVNFENILGSQFDDVLIGNGGSNSLHGGAGNDFLDGGTGGDRLYGGYGDDIYIVYSSADIVIELRGEGQDTVHSYGSDYTIQENVEDLRIMSGADADGTGNAFDNVIYAGSGNNILDGGLGIDMVSYRFASGGVSVSLAATGAQVTGGSGTDTLHRFENLEGSNFSDHLTGGTVAPVLTNGAAGNVLYGLGGNDYLKGGSGSDMLIGGTGDDTYYLDDASDVIVELDGEGRDRAFVSLVEYKMEENLEDLVILSAGGTYHGNDLANTMESSVGGSIIAGGKGNDLLIGGGGADTYLFNRGDGQDSIVNGGGYVKFDIDIDSNELWFARNGNDLVVSVIGAGDSVTIVNWAAHQDVGFYSSGGSGILVSGMVSSLVNRMAAFSPPSPGQTSLSPQAADVMSGYWR